MKPPWNDFRQQIFLDRYALRSKDGKLLEQKPEQMWRRVAKAVGSNKDEIEEFYSVLEDFKFVPGGRQLSGLGSEKAVTLYNCYVLSFESNDKTKGNDSKEAIMDTFSRVVQIASKGGGVGLNWSILRPRDSYVSSAHGKSSGAVSWSIALDSIIRQVSQGGSRRGALMFMLNDWHPDIEEFIKVKNDLSVITTANLSVGISDSFMKAVKNDEDWELMFPVTSCPSYNGLWNGDIYDWVEADLPIKVYKTIKAKKLWNLIAQSAHKSAEPGVIFLDQCNKMSNISYLHKIIGTNPCGEMPLEGYGCCNLGAINLISFIDKKGKFDWGELKQTVETSVKFLDNVIDIENYILPQVEEHQKEIRRIGLGVMGLGDTLAVKGLKYGSKDSLKFIEALFATIRNIAYEFSIKLAQQRGPAPGYKEEFLRGKFIQKLPKEIRAKIGKFKIRNLHLLTVAPTGSTGLLSGTSSGIEPIFSLEYIRNDRTGTHEVVCWLKEKVPDKFLVTTDKLTPEQHVRVQSKIQEFVDASVSKTVNSPQNVSIQDVEKIFNSAYKWECKGITFFREGSRRSVLTRVKTRPEKLEGFTQKIKTTLGTLYFTQNFKDGKLFEIFCQIGRGGTDVSSFTEALSRMVSLSLRGGINVKEIAKQLRGIGGPPTGLGQTKRRSVPDSISRALSPKQASKHSGELCPNCGIGLLRAQEGCFTCDNCGFSKCS